MGHNGRTLHFPECSINSQSSCDKLHMWYLTLLVIIAKKMAAKGSEKRLSFIWFFKKEAKLSEKRRIWRTL